MLEKLARALEGLRKAREHPVNISWARCQRHLSFQMCTPITTCVYTITVSLPQSQSQITEMNCMYLGPNLKKKKNIVKAFLDQLKKSEHRLVIK